MGQRKVAANNRKHFSSTAEKRDVISQSIKKKVRSGRKVGFVYIDSFTFMMIHKKIMRGRVTISPRGLIFCRVTMALARYVDGRIEFKEALTTLNLPSI